MGAKPKPKGNRFERKIARMIEAAWPGVKAYRTLQSDGAYDSDVTVEGCALLSTIWWECNDAKAPNPLNKLVQAKGDCEAALARTGLDRFPIAVTHKTAARTIYVTTYNWVWLSLCARTVLKSTDALGDLVVRVTWEDFVMVVSQARNLRQLETGQDEIHNKHETREVGT